MSKHNLRRGLIPWRGQGHNVEVVQKDPKDFLGDVDHLLVPDPVRSRFLHLGDELDCLACFYRVRVAEKRQDGAGAGDFLAGRGRVLDVSEQDGSDNVPRGELGRPLLFGVKDEMQQRGEEGRVDGVEVFQRQ